MLAGTGLLELLAEVARFQGTLALGYELVGSGAAVEDCRRGEQTISARVAQVGASKSHWASGVVEVAVEMVGRFGVELSQLVGMSRMLMVLLTVMVHILAI